MSARTKLNGIIFGGVLVFSALLGGVTGSWLIFVIAAVVGAGLMIHAGEVRLKTADGDNAYHQIQRNGTAGRTEVFMAAI